jgi:hypothetical protein
MIIKLFEEFNDDLENLKELLNSYNIPIDLWGTGKSKTINNLLNELENDECSLEEKNHKITRYIEFVGIKIYYTKDDEIFILKEDRQEFNDGRIRRRDMPSSVSEKMVFGEDPIVASIRGIREELGVKIEAHQLTKHSDLNYNGGSLSYPGLDTKYKGHKFICNLIDEQFNPNGYVEIQKDKKTFFIWEKLN